MFPVVKRIKIRQWAPLFTLFAGFGGGWVGVHYFGEQQSWIWFGAGVFLALIIVGIAYRRKYVSRPVRRTANRS